MRVLVTGALGFIGLEVVRSLALRGINVIACDFNSELAKRTDHREFNERYVSHLIGALSLCEDFIEPKSVDEKLLDSGADAIVHLGGLVDTMAEPSKLMEMNLEATKKLLAASGKTNGRLIVYASSAACSNSGGHTKNVYGLSKLMAERVVIKRNGIALRFHNVYGPFEHHKGTMASMPFKMCKSYLQGGEFDLFASSSERDFVHVSDVAETVAEVTHGIFESRHIPALTRGQVYDLGCGVPETFKSLDEMLQKKTETSVSRAREVPMPMKLVGRYQTHTKAGEHRKNAPQLVGIKPMDLSAGLDRLIEEMR